MAGKKSGIAGLFLLGVGALLSFDGQTRHFLRALPWDVNSLENLVLSSGLSPETMLSLKPAAYRPDDQTDLLLHFDRPAELAVDRGDHYVGLPPFPPISQKAFLGEGAVLFSGDTHLRLQGSDGAFFSQESLGSSFSVEFWLNPLSLTSGEVVLSWHGFYGTGQNALPQRMEAFFSERRLVWEFESLFLSVESIFPTLFSLKGSAPLTPGHWSHHRLRFNEKNGLLEYLVNGQEVAIVYTTSSKHERGILYKPMFSHDSGLLHVGTTYVGLMDELRITRNPHSKSSLVRFPSYGLARTTPIDLSRPNSYLFRLQNLESLPHDSQILYYYHFSNSWKEVRSLSLSSLRSARLSLQEGWQKVPPEGLLPEARGRYLVVGVALYPDARQQHTPSVGILSAEYVPASLPPAPINLTLTQEEEALVLRWEGSMGEEEGGYQIFYGTQPGEYLGNDGPIDVKSSRKHRFTSLVPGVRYFFSVRSYWKGDETRLFSPLSPEVSFRF